MWTVVFNANTNVIYLVECQEFLAFAFLVEPEAHRNSYITMSTIRNETVKSWWTGNRDVAGALRMFQHIDTKASVLASDWNLSYQECLDVMAEYDKGVRFIERRDGRYRYHYKIYTREDVLRYLQRREKEVR